MDNETIFKNAIEDYVQDESKLSLLEKIKKINIDSCIFHYVKADCYNLKRNYEQALFEIKEVLKYNLNDPNVQYSNGINLDLCKVYSLAGQLFAINGDKKNSLKNYQKYQFYLKTKSSFSDKDSIIVYSFRRYNEYTLADLINKEITVCHPSEMNDPFDTLVFEWNRYLPNICTEKTHIEPFQESFDYYKIRSFVANWETMDVDDNIVSKILMWSHYTDSHKGLCLRYRLSKSFFENVNDKKLISQRLRKISYEQNNISVNLTEIGTTLAYATKSHVWEKEDEVRLIYYNPDVSSHFYGVPLDPESCVEAVYFGIKMEEKNKRTIRNTLRRKKVKYYDMKNDPDNIFNIRPILLK